MDIFSTREIATGLWALVLIAFSLALPQPRRALADLGKVLLHRQLLITLALLFGYILLCVWVLWKIGLWDVSHLKATIIWSFAVAVLSVAKAATADSSVRHVRNWVADNLKLLVLVEFVLSRYTFPLLFELILIPVVTAIAMMAALANSRPELQAARAFLNVVLTVVGSVLVGFALYQMVHDLTGFASIQTARDFSIPPILSLLLIPFLFGIHRYAAYERNFLILTTFMPDDDLRRYACWRAFLSFRSNVAALDYWRRHVALFRPHNREAVRASISETKQAFRRRKNPQPVELDAGWPPPVAGQFLQDHGLPAMDYYQTAEIWMATSAGRKLGKLDLDRLEYEMEGEESAAKLLRLRLTAHHAESVPDSEAAFLAAAETLIRKAIGDVAWGACSDIVMTPNDARAEVGNIRIVANRQKLTYRLPDSCERTLIVSVKDYSSPY